MSAQSPLKQRPLRRTYLASFVGALAIIAVGLGAAPAQAAGSFLPGYDPGVRGTIDYGIANCGIVLFEAANFKGKKICAAEERWPLSQPYVARVGGDMEWREKVSSVQVRPGYVLMLEDKQFLLRGFQADVSNPGDWNDRAWTMWVTEAFDLQDGNNNGSIGRPVTAMNAVSCTPLPTVLLDERPEKAVDGSVASIYTTKWCGSSPGVVVGGVLNKPPTLQVDLGLLPSGNARLINGVVVHHAGDGPLTILKTQREPDTLNTLKYTIKVGNSSTGPWTTIGTFDNPNRADLTNHLLRGDGNTLYRGRYVQLEINVASAIDRVARIQEFEVLVFNR